MTRPPLPSPEEVAPAMKPLLERGPIVLALDPCVAFLVLGTLQLALRHPAMRGATAELPREVARALALPFEDSPVLAAVVEAGWDPSSDEELG